MDITGPKIEIRCKYKLTKKSLPIIYTPGVAEVSKALAKNKKKVFDHTFRKNSVAVVSDGSAVLGLGNLGPEAALPVMEGKAVLFRELGGIDAVPIVLSTQDPGEIVKIVKSISATFGGINLEDISAPRCFDIERKLIESLDIPVFHDDQHGTAIVVLAGLINALAIVRKSIKKVKIVISGAGAAGMAITWLLQKYGARNIIVCDSKGSLYPGRDFGGNTYKDQVARSTNPQKFSGSMREALKGADVFIGVSAPNLIKAADIQQMNEKAIVFSLSNPVPEIMPHEAKKGGAAIVATGRSDFPNQINNVLAFPGIFRGALDSRTRFITDKIKIKVAEAIAGLVAKPNSMRIVPPALDRRVPQAVAKVFGASRKNVVK